jgi:hypothetical protein
LLGFESKGPSLPIEESMPVLSVVAMLFYYLSFTQNSVWHPKLRSPQIETVHQVNAYGQISKSIPWLVAFDRIPASTQARAKELKVMYTGFSEYEELKKMVESTST